MFSTPASRSSGPGVCTARWDCVAVDKTLNFRSASTQPGVLREGGGGGG